jgi:hypothetical protein
MAKPFTFRMRAYAAAHFEWDDVLTVTWADAEAKLQSEYTGGKDGRAYAVTIHGEIRGVGESIEEAEPRLANSIGNTLPLIAVAANAAVADPLPIAAHGLDLSDSQPLVYYRTPDPSSWFPPGNRRIDAEATRALMTAVGHHSQTELLHRAMEAYRRALSSWIPETQLLAGELLFIAAETLSRALIESRASALGITPKNLARLEKVNGEKALRMQALSQEIFDGDSKAFQAMKEASNGFEHGYMAVDQVRGLLQPVLERSMGHVRRALITASGVEQEAADRLLSDTYATPRGLVPVIMMVRGQLSRQDPDKQPQTMEGAPVELEWSPSPPAVTKTADGEVHISFTDQATVKKLPSNVRLELSGFGIRAAHVKQSQPFVVDVEVTRADGTTETVETDTSAITGDSV